MPKSLRKHIRKEKARIRREVLDIGEQQDKIQELYDKFVKQNDNSRDTQLSHK